MIQGRRILAVSAAAGSVMGIALLLRFPPAQYGFYPECPVHAYLHLLCPGCGATRSMAALLHGRWSEALRLNVLFVVLLPFLVGYAAVCFFRAWGARPFRWPELPQIAVQAALAAALLFMVVRNVPR
jgi:hypothetical protein